MSKQRSKAVCVLFLTALISCLAYADVYQDVHIVAPKPDTTVHNNSGNLTVEITISPPLHAEAGDRIAILLDGKEMASGTGSSYKLTSIDRGSHMLTVEVKSTDGTILVASPPVEFHMWRASRFFQNREN